MDCGYKCIVLERVLTEMILFLFFLF